MNKSAFGKLVWAAPWIAGAGAAGCLIWWFSRNTPHQLTCRLPGTDRPAGAGDSTSTNAVLLGRLIQSSGRVVEMPGAWPQFRGPERNGISPEASRLAHEWGATGPRALWSMDIGEGYAGAAVRNGRVYLMDYDREHRQDTLRCLSLADGQEIWRYAYPVAVKRNHGMSRTVPAVTEKVVVAIGPKCHVLCVDAATGQLRWGLDLVRDFDATVPPWYTGQCPLIDGDKVILAPGGTNALLLAVDIESGRVLWQTPNPMQWQMTHSSVMPMEFAGGRMYVYCASRGVVGVSARDGALLWQDEDWKISIATVPSPVPLSDGRIFLSGGYDAGSMLIGLKEGSGRLAVETVFRLGPEVFGATQHTPIARDGYLYGVRPDGQLVCLSLDGKVVWASGLGQQFGLGSFLMAGDLMFALNDRGKLSLLEATPAGHRLLAQAQVLNGRESWGPMALAGGRLLARDLTRLVCLDVAQH